jgi:hypothetical protein
MTLQQEATVLRQLTEDYKRETDALAIRIDSLCDRLASGVFPQLPADAGFEAELAVGELFLIGRRLRVLGKDDSNAIPGGVGSLDAPGLSEEELAALQRSNLKRLEALRKPPVEAEELRDNGAGSAAAGPDPGKSEETVRDVLGEALKEKPVGEQQP